MDSKIKRPLFVSITGDIASGKTLCGSYFKEKRYKVYSADEIGRDIMNNKQNLKKICEIFKGYEINNRSDIRNIVFSDPKELEKLNNFMHPKIKEKIKLIKEKYNLTDTKQMIVIFEIPLLFECKMEKWFDFNILIVAEDDVKIKRIIRRDKCGAKEAKFILLNQMKQAIKMQKADLIIENNDEESIFINKLEIVEHMLKFIRKRVK